MATHSSTLGWKIPGMAEPGGAAVYGVAQSWTRLRQLQLSSSSSSSSSSMSPKMFMLIYILSKVKYIKLLAETFAVKNNKAPQIFQDIS